MAAAPGDPGRHSVQSLLIRLSVGNSMRIVFLLLWPLALFASQVSAQNRTVSDLEVALGEWQLVPTLVGAKVESFVALRDPALAVGDNVTAIWFLREATGDWHSLAWPVPDQSKSIAHVKKVLGLSDSSDAMWPETATEGDLDPANASEPSPFGVGLFESDPLTAIVESLPEPGHLSTT